MTATVEGEPFLLNERARAELWVALVEIVEEHLRSVEKRPVAPRIDPESMRAFLSPFTFESCQPPDVLLRRVASTLADHQIHTAHPCYFGLFNPAPTTMGIAADALVAALNPQLAAWTHSPLAAEIERHLINALAERFGYVSPNADGIFTTGGAESNTTGVLCALIRRWPQVAREGLRGLNKPPVFYLAAEGHHSFVKAARSTGLGANAVREVGVTDELTLDPQQLRAMIASDRRAGLEPFLVVGTAGTTSVGAIDPLSDLAQIAEEEGLWFHVDAAWAGAVRLVPEYAHWLRGIERADSITFDAHKWLSVPMGSGIFLTRQPEALTQAFEINAGYMPRERRDLDPVDPYAHSLQWSRRFIGLKLFLSLGVAGWNGYAKELARQIELGALLRDGLSSAGWRLVNKTVLPIACFTPADQTWAIEAHQALADEVARSGRAWISTVVTRKGEPALRACITSYRTAPKHVEILIDALSEARHRLESR